MRTIAIILCLALAATAQGPYDHLVTQPAYHTGPEETIYLSREDAKADLGELAQLVTERSSYLWSAPFKHRQAIQFMQEHLPERLPVPVFHFQVNKFIQLLGDSHGRVRGLSRYLPKRRAQCRFGLLDGRILALHAEKNSLLKEGYPYVSALDGIPVEKWLDKAIDVTVGHRASMALKQATGFRYLRHVTYLRSELGQQDKETLRLELDDGKGKKHQAQVAVSAEKPAKRFPIFPLLGSEHCLLPNNIGYLRITNHLDQKLPPSIHDAMEKFRDTKALIIDARQCGGGSRDNLATLLPYFISPKEGPFIANCARIRLPKEERDLDPLGRMTGRRMTGRRMTYIDSPSLTKVEKTAIASFLQDFTPEFEPSLERFSDWYFMLMHANPQGYFYDRPVYLLIDWGVGSAGDVFASAFKGRKGITLCGTPSVGMSGRSKVFSLANSRVKVRLSTMASFQRTGRKFDGVGVLPDIPMEPRLQDWLGIEDTVLKRVLELVPEAAKN